MPQSNPTDCPAIGRELHAPETIILEGGQLAVDVTSATDEPATDYCQIQYGAPRLTSLARKAIEDRTEAHCGVCGNTVCVRRSALPPSRNTTP